MSWISSAERIRGPAKKNAIDFSHGMEAKHTMNVHVSWVSSAERIRGPAKNAIDFSLSMEVKTYKERAHVVGQ